MTAPPNYTRQSLDAMWNAANEIRAAFRDAARDRAIAAGRDLVTDEDVQAVIPGVLKDFLEHWRP